MIHSSFVADCKSDSGDYSGCEPPAETCAANAPCDGIDGLVNLARFDQLN
jgi:hypothetical protein